MKPLDTRFQKELYDKIINGQTDGQISRVIFDDWLGTSDFLIKSCLDFCKVKQSLEETTSEQPKQEI